MLSVCEDIQLSSNVVCAQVLEEIEGRSFVSDEWGQIAVDMSDDEREFAFDLHTWFLSWRLKGVLQIKKLLCSVDMQEENRFGVLNRDNIWLNCFSVMGAAVENYNVRASLFRQNQKIISEIKRFALVAEQLRQKADIKNKCESFLDLPEGWDGYSAKKISRDVVDDVVQFVDLIPSEIALPKIGASAGNEILCKWKNKENLVLISFFGDGKCHGYAKIRGQKDRKGNILLSGGSIDEKILSWIKYF